jgi:hypothetical protein
MTWMSAVRIGKAVALIGFLLPWLVVSCQGTEIATATGLQMATGDIDIANGMGGRPPDVDPALWVVLVLLLAVGGLAASFLLKPVKRAAAAAAGLALTATLIAAIGMPLTLAEAKRPPSQSGDSWEAGMGQAAAASMRVETRLGYWLTLLGLAGAALSGAFVVQGRAMPKSSQEARELLAGLNTIGDDAKEALKDTFASLPKTGFPTAAPSRSEDVRYWDRMPDKNEPDALEEYLVRYPQGQFVALARARLARAGREAPPLTMFDTPTAPAVSAVETEAQPDLIATEPDQAAIQSVEPKDASPPAWTSETDPAHCPACGTPVEPNANFCTSCGLNLGSGVTGRSGPGAA